LLDNVNDPQKYLIPVFSFIAVSIAFTALIINYSNVFLKNDEKEKMKKLVNWLIPSFLYPIFFIIFVVTMTSGTAGRWQALLYIEFIVFFILFLFSVVVLFCCLGYFFHFILFESAPKLENKKYLRLKNKNKKMTMPRRKLARE
jgi:Na+/H+-dicarboxylate symporter